MRELLIGCIADDFTGASDIASFFVKAGLETLLVNEMPDADTEIPDTTDCIVIALKTRTMPVELAVSQSLLALNWLDQAGAQKLYFKYCSTFDSTPEGNIGPVIDAVLDTYGFDFTLLCPSVPVNGRMVKNGNLYVNGVLLHESHMKDHPLTPMRQSAIADLMAPQGKYQSYLIPVTCLEEMQLPGETPCYLIPDYYEEEHGRLIAKHFKDCRFFTGGSGLGEALAEILAEGRQEAGSFSPAAVAGDGVILAGSCSAVTLAQIEHYVNSGGPSYRIDPVKLISGKDSPEHIWDWITEQQNMPLVYSSAPAAEIKQNQEYGRELVAESIEALMAELAVLAVRANRKRIIVAGGETSGAVTKALGFRTFHLTDSVAPGVPVMIPAGRSDIRLVLKSGNFGQPDFFCRAAEMTKRGEV